MAGRVIKSTIKDVAREAGVSIATVSFVLNNRPGQVISDPVKQRVFEAARLLNYHPSALAAGLASRKPGNIAIVFYKDGDLVSNLYYSFVLEGAIREAARMSVNIMFSYVDEDWESRGELPRVVREGSTAGIIFVNQVHPDMVRDIEQRGVPVVLVDHYPQIEGVNAVEIDNFRGGQLPVEHLVALGHRHIAYVYAKADRPSIRGRLDGFQSAIRRAGASESLWDCEEFTFYAARDLAMEKLVQKNRPTAVVAANDELASGVLRAAQRLCIKVPDALSVVGFDNITMGYYTDPPLTTVGGDKEGLGARAVRRLVDAVQDRAVRISTEVLPVELIIRGSTGPVPEA